MAITNYGRNAIMNYVLQGTAFGTAITSWNFGLFNVLPSATGSDGTEVAGSGYSRVNKAQNSTTWPNNGPSGCSNNGVTVTFATPGSGGWGTVVGWGLWDNSGNLWFYGPIGNPGVVAASAPPPVFTIGSLTICMGCGC